MWKLNAPTCQGCPYDMHYSQSIAIKQNGVTMHFGERYCTGAKRARRFKRNDPKFKVPCWCPKRKTPRELRIYCFENTESWLMHENLCHALNREIPPEGHRYALEYEGTTALTPQEFLERCDLEPETSLLGVPVYMHYVVEIDDGLKPVFFYKTLEGYRYEPFFNASKARANKLVSHEGTV